VRFDLQLGRLLGAQAVLLTRHVFVCGCCAIRCVKISTINKILMITKIFLYSLLVMLGCHLDTELNNCHRNVCRVPVSWLK
jgi:hypothetical protein